MTKSTPTEIKGKKKEKQKTRKDLKPFGNVIQVCPECGKVDVFLNDKHTCDRNYQEYRTNRD